MKLIVTLCKKRDRFSDLEHPYGNDSNTNANRRFTIGAKESAQKKVVMSRRSHPLHMKPRVMNAGKSTARIATQTATQRIRGYTMSDMEPFTSYLGGNSGGILGVSIYKI